MAIFDYGQTPDGVFYYAMEYLEGLNLEAFDSIDGPQPAARVIHILRQVGRFPGGGARHRPDSPPANVILVAERGGATDVAKVVDFGLVKELNTTTDVTGDNQVEGTPHYFAPETLSSPDDIGPQTDLDSLGCVGYFLLTGHTVFEGRTAVEVCGHHLHSQPVPPAERIRPSCPTGAHGHSDGLPGQSAGEAAGFCRHPRRPPRRLHRGGSVDARRGPRLVGAARSSGTGACP